MVFDFGFGALHAGHWIEVIRQVVSPEQIFGTERLHFFEVLFLRVSHLGQSCFNSIEVDSFGLRAAKIEDLRGHLGRDRLVFEFLLELELMQQDVLGYLDVIGDNDQFIANLALFQNYVEMSAAVVEQ